MRNRKRFKEAGVLNSIPVYEDLWGRVHRGQKTGWAAMWWCHGKKAELDKGRQFLKNEIAL